MFGWIRRRKPIILAQWYVPLLDFQSDTELFYGALEGEVRRRRLPNLLVERIDFKQMGILSAKREYLRFRHERLVCDVCSGAFGSCWWFSARAAVLPRILRVYEVVLTVLGLIGFYASYRDLFGPSIGTMVFCSSLFFLLMIFFAARRWAYLDDFLIYLPVVGALYDAYVRRDTYHRQDQRRMFGEIVNTLVRMKVIEFCAAGGVDEPEFVKVDSPDQVLTERQLAKYLGERAEKLK